MPRPLAAAAAAACLCSAVAAAPAPGPARLPIRLVEKSGGFSYVLPAGWRVRALPGFKYRLSYGKPSQRFAPNVNVVDETAAMPLAEYARLNLTQMQRTFPGFHALGLTPFVTRSGLRGFRMRAEATPAGPRLRQTNYLFAASGNRKVIATFSWLASDGSKYDNLADATMKTFTLK